MLQCVEQVEQKTHNVTAITYRRAWLRRYENSSRFQGKATRSWLANCNVENPSWEGLPVPGVVYAESVRIGAFTVHEDLLRSVPLEVRVTRPTIANWTKQGGHYRTEQWVVPGARNKFKIGHVRVSFFTNDWQSREVTVLGQNHMGSIIPWEASPSWLCPASSLLKLRMRDTWTKEKFFEDMHTKDGAVVWVCRFAGLGALWIAFGLLAAPVGVAADCVPWIGPKLGDSAESVTCCLAVVPASCCCSLVVGVVWMALYPFFGVATVVLFGAACVCVALSGERQRGKAVEAARRVTPLVHRTCSAPLVLHGAVA